MAKALQAGTGIVVCGRLSAPSLVVGPAMTHCGWSWDGWGRLGRVTMVCRLLEDGFQVSRSYCADPGGEDVAAWATTLQELMQFQAADTAKRDR